MNNSLPLITSRFVLAGLGLDPNICTSRISIIPTDYSSEEKVTGRNILTGEPYIKKPFWSLEFEKEPSDSIEDGLCKLLEILWPKRDNVTSLINSLDCYAGFTSSVTIYKDRPLYCIGPGVLSQMAYFNAEYCLDIYDYSD